MKERDHLLLSSSIFVNKFYQICRIN